MNHAISNVDCWRYGLGLGTPGKVGSWSALQSMQAHQILDYQATLSSRFFMSCIRAARFAFAVVNAMTSDSTNVELQSAHQGVSRRNSAPLHSQLCSFRTITCEYGLDHTRGRNNKIEGWEKKLRCGPTCLRGPTQGGRAKRGSARKLEQPNFKTTVAVHRRRL